MQVDLTINGRSRTLEASNADSLLDVLRDAGYTGAKRGCDTGACGFCTVIVDGEARNSCILPAARVDGATVETVEGLGTQSDLHPVQQAFVDNTALQCGFCIPGMIMRTTALLDENPDPSEAEIREGLSENLCRCTGYKKIVAAVDDAADALAAGEDPDSAGDSEGAGDSDGSGDSSLAADGGRLAACGCCTDYPEGEE